jgi:hypothetical protein
VSQRWQIEEDFPAPPQPFTKRSQFNASLAYRGKTLEDLEVVLDWDELGQSDPRGWVLGNNETYAAIEKLGERGLPHDAVIATLQQTTVATVDVTEIRSRGYEKGPTGTVASFVCRDLCFRHDFNEPVSAKRSITFLMAGPYAHWGAQFSRRVSYTGEATVKTYDTSLLDDVVPHFSFAIRPHFFYSSHSDDQDRRQERCARVLSITVTTEVGRELLSDDEFIRSATEAIDDASLLVSFLSGSWTTWYGYFVSTGDRLVEYFRQTRRGQAIDRQDTPVQTPHVREFLRRAVSRLRLLRAENREPRLALLHTISAAEATSLEERFIRLFFALESLKDLHARSQEREWILPEKRFAKVRRKVRSALEELVSSEDALLSTDEQAALERKLPELNRPAFAELLENLLRDHGVEWRDLYPPHADLSRPRFIALRDKLVHTGTVDPTAALDLETIRLQGLVERVLLRMLDWEDISSAPRSWFRMLLLKKLGDEALDSESQPR